MAPPRIRAGRPLVVVEGPAGILGRPMAAALAAARRNGWEIVRGWVAPAGNVRVVCTGTIRTAEDAREALRAAGAGAGLIVDAVADRATLDRFVEDLNRIGPVVHLRDGTGGSRGLTSGQRAVLGLLAEGLTIGQAAASLGIARQTATRRLAAARDVLGVESTAAAVSEALGPRR